MHGGFRSLFSISFAVCPDPRSAFVRTLGTSGLGSAARIPAGSRPLLRKQELEDASPLDPEYASDLEPEVLRVPRTLIG